MNTSAGGPASRWNLRSKAALAVTGGVTLALVTAGPVFAHDNAVTASVVCNTATHQWELSWSVENDYGLKETVIASSDPAIFAAPNNRIDEYGTLSQTEIVAGPIDKTLTVTAVWDDNWPSPAGLARSGSISKSDFKGTCEAPLVASASITVTPETCTSGAILHYGPSENSSYSGTPDGAEGPTSYNVVSTRTTTATFPAGDGVSGDGTTKTFTDDLPGPLDPNDNPDCRGPVPPDDPTYSDGEPYWECTTPGELRPAEVSFLRTHYKAVSSWNGTTYEYGAPQFDYDEVITIPTPDGFDATCPPTVLELPSALMAKPGSCPATEGSRIDPTLGDHQSFAWVTPVSSAGINSGTFTAELGWVYPGGNRTVTLSVDVPGVPVIQCLPHLAATGMTGLMGWVGQNMPLVMTGTILFIITCVPLIIWGYRRSNKMAG